MTCYLFQFIHLKETISIPLKKKLALLESLYYKNQSFPWFDTHFDERPKILTYRQTSPNIFWLRNKKVKHRAQRECFKFFITKDN